jgi:hypothetical protein
MVCIIRQLGFVLAYNEDQESRMFGLAAAHRRYSYVPCPRLSHTWDSARYNVYYRIYIADPYAGSECTM